MVENACMAVSKHVHLPYVWVEGFNKQTTMLNSILTKRFKINKLIYLYL